MIRKVVMSALFSQVLIPPIFGSKLQFSGVYFNYISDSQKITLASFLLTKTHDLVATEAKHRFWPQHHIRLALLIALSSIGMRRRSISSLRLRSQDSGRRSSLTELLRQQVIRCT
jgi:hypothetical protein